MPLFARLRPKFRQKRQTATSAPSLPAELVCLILDFAVQSSPSCAAVVARVCQFWYHRATCTLYASPTLRSEEQIRRFRHCVAKSPRLASRLTSLVLDGSRTTNVNGVSTTTRSALVHTLPQLLPLLPNVKRVQLRFVDILTFTNFSNAENLEELEIISASIFDATCLWRQRPFFVTLPALRKLGIRDTRFDEFSASQFFSREFLPQVCTIDLLARNPIVDGPIEQNSVGEVVKTTLENELAGTTVRCAWDERAKEDGQARGGAVQQ